MFDLCPLMSVSACIDCITEVHQIHNYVFVKKVNQYMTLFFHNTSLGAEYIKDPVPIYILDSSVSYKYVYMYMYAYMYCMCFVR